MRLPILIALVSVLVGGSLDAASATVDLRRVDSSLVDLPFGGSVEQVVGWVKDRLSRDFAPRIKAAVDDNERARLRAQLDREIFEFRQQMVTFDGRRTGYEVSPVAGEFMVGSDERLAVLRDGLGDHFFFFIGDRFWKYGRLLRPDNPFADRIAAQARRMGAPVTVDTVAERGQEPAPVRATWRGDRLELRLWNRRLLYGYDVMFLDYRPIADRIDDLRGGRVAEDHRLRVDPALEDFLLDDDEDEEEFLRGDP